MSESPVAESSDSDADTETQTEGEDTDAEAGSTPAAEAETQAESTPADADAEAQVENIPADANADTEAQAKSTPADADADTAAQAESTPAAEASAENETENHRCSRSLDTRPNRASVGGPRTGTWVKTISAVSLQTPLTINRKPDGHSIEGRENRQAVFLVAAPFGMEGGRLKIRLKHEFDLRQKQLGSIPTCPHRCRNHLPDRFQDQD